MENSLNKKQYPLIDLMKFVMAIVVISIHRSPFTGVHNYIIEGMLGGMAVPFFFIVSSYLFFKKVKNNDNQSRSILFNYEKRLLKVYIIWFIIYSFGLWIKNYIGALNMLSLESFLENCVTSLKYFFIDGSYIHLWYMSSLIISVPVVYLFSRHFGSIKTISIGIILFFLNFVLIQNSDSIKFFASVPEWIKNVAGTGFLCVAIGEAMTNQEYSRINNKKTAVFLALSIIFLSVVGFMTYTFFPQYTNLVDYVAGLIKFFAAYLIMKLCLNTDMKSSKILVYMRNISILMYFSHKMLMKELYVILADFSGVSFFETSTVFQFFADLLFAILFATIVLWLSNKKGFKWLKNLY